MSFEIIGRIKEVVYEFDENNKWQLKAVRLIPDAEYSLRDGNIKKCIIKNSSTAKLLSYSEYVEIVCKELFDNAHLFSVSRRVRLVLNSEHVEGITIQSDIMSGESNGSEKSKITFDKLSEIGFLP